MSEDLRLAKLLRSTPLYEGSGEESNLGEDAADTIERLTAKNERNAAIAFVAMKKVELVQKERDEARAALQPFAEAPPHGIYGGPMVQAKLIYEDSSDENTARHRGRIDPKAFQRARAVLIDKPDPANG